MKNKKIKTKQKNLAGLILFLTLLLILPNLSLAANDLYIEWKTDSDWGSWTKDKTIASSGLKLSSTASGYETQGTATYNFSPGGKNTWSKVSSETENTVGETGNYLWVAVYDRNSVSQIDATTGTIIKEWPVGIDPSRTSVGCDNDVWVGDRAGGAISHIIPEEDKVITRTVGGGLTYIRSVSVQCVSSNESYVWVGDSNTGNVVQIDAKKFDSLPPGVAATSVQVGSTISVCSGGYCPYGSVFSSGYKKLYIAHYSGGIYIIDVATHTISSYAASATGYTMNNDWLGNAWRDYSCARVKDTGELVTPSGCSFNNLALGIAILPPFGSENAKIARVGGNSGFYQSLCVADLNNNNTDSPSIGSFSCSGNVIVGVGAGLGYDKDKNIWAVARTGGLVYKFLKLTNYATYQSFPSNTLGGLNYTYSDFLGNALSNVSNTITYQFSPDGGTTWYSDEDLNAGRIPDSAGLLIKLTLNGSGLTTPILKKLRLDYAHSGNTGSLYMEKRMFKWSDSGGRSGDLATFDPTDWVVSRIKIESGENEGLTLKVKDYRPSGIPDIDIKNITEAEKQTKCGLSAGESLLGGDFNGRQDNDYSYWDNISMGKNQAGYLCYQYRIPANYEPKNILIQARAQTLSKEQGNELTVGTSNNFMMIKGFPILTSQPESLDNNPVKTFPQINDLFAVSSVRAEQPSATNPNFGWTIGYFYKRGLGQASRGGNAVSLPVKMTTKSGEILSMDPFWILYNPSYYLFGNMFSGNSDAGTALDFSSRSNAITRQSYQNSSKLNSEAALYNYEFDKDSVVYWDETNRDRNKAMEENIRRLVADPKPEIVCKVSNLNAFETGQVNLNSNDCNLSSQPGTNIKWPNGRVWYLKTNTSSDQVEIGSSIRGRGTIIIDGPGKAVISTSASDYPNDSSFGLIAINGAKVEFGTNAERFNGIVFAPTGSPCSIEFIKDGKAMKIRGSLVGENICFNPRNKAGNRYAVSIYADASILKLPLPGFENFISVNYGQ